MSPMATNTVHHAHTSNNGEVTHKQLGRAITILNRNNDKSFVFYNSKQDLCVGEADHRYNK